MVEIPIPIVICIGVVMLFIGALVGIFWEKEAVKNRIVEAVDLSEIPVGGGKIVHLTAKVQFRSGKVKYLPEHGFTELSNPEYLD